ncbi:DUF2663 family protein [Sutcliffiella rhizosphaerae]|uniref:DUF2663 family protein n=1 Tax=Sutcliffiella rhizosphaerae TaxID=2880967 RepID=A0ABN8AE02_9BACI|nr:DUF2663 family protein [Sutcliffiella rhizosphaerae]CAG9623503.1 hypothetical protein BACCIP111883_04316 [Sutcliffiella rhizosphaerae]
MIKMLGQHTDEATKQTLQLLVNKKRKFDNFKKRELRWRIACCLTLGLFIGYIYYFLFHQSYSTAASISYFFDRSVHLWIVMFIGFQLGMIKYLLYKKDKTEKEYHDLRKEMVKRSDDYWSQPEDWKQRHLVYDMMKKEFDINLFHETK